MRGVNGKRAAGTARGLPNCADTAEDTLRTAVERHHPALVLACSFQKEESVLIDMLMRIEPSARVFTIDTGVLFPATYEVWRKVEDRYGLRVEVVDATPPNGTPWSAANCCGMRKVDALEEALRGTEAWITGIRREQSPTRADAEAIEWDESRGVWKFNPLADWTDHDVWSYVNQHDLPYHPLHDRGYESIGCAPCTLPGNGREGRWAGQDKTECGLHV
jgi:phosphoadenosine phosphosulfate reductase